MTILIDIKGGMSLDGKFPALIVGTAYYGRVTASGGTPFYTYKIMQGVLPDGLTLDTITGEVTGTPTDNKMTAITVRATDLQGMYVERTFVLPAANVITQGTEHPYTDMWFYKVVPGSRFSATATYADYDDIPWKYGKGGFGSFGGGNWTGASSTHGWIANTGPVGEKNGQIFNRGHVVAGQTVVIRADDGHRAWINGVLVSDWYGPNTFTADRTGELITQCADSYPSGSYGGIFLGTSVTSPALT